MRKWFLGLVAALGIGAAVTVASASDVRIEITQQGDSVRAIARWSPRCDVRGCPDGYRVQWARGSAAQPERTVTGRADTAWFAAAAFGDSVRIAAAVKSVRRGQESVPVTVARWIVNRDAPPPPPDSLAIDTLAATIPPGVDSVRVRLSASAIEEGDSLRAVAQFYLAAGATRAATDTISWAVAGPPTGVVLVRPFGSPLRDSAWIVAVSCGCEESRDAVLDVNRNQWVVRVADGTVRPVTPRRALLGG